MAATSVAGSFIQTLTMVDVDHGLDGVPALGDAGRFAGLRGDQPRTESVPLALARRGLRQRQQRLHERCRRTMVSRTEARSHTLARVQEERSSVRRGRRMVPSSAVSWAMGASMALESARVMGRLYAAARLYVNFFQPSFKLKEKRREGAKVIKLYHPPSTPYERALAHPKVTAAVKKRLRDQYRSLDPGRAVGRDSSNPGRTRQSRRSSCRPGARPANPLTRAPRRRPQRRSRKRSARRRPVGEPRATHRRTRRPYKTRVRMPSKLDPHIAAIEDLARRAAAINCARNCRPAEREIPRGVRDGTAFDCAASAEGAQDGRLPNSWSLRARSATPRPLPHCRGCGRLGLCRARAAHSPSRRASREKPPGAGRSIDIGSSAAMAPSG